MTIYEAKIVMGVFGDFNEATLKSQYRKMARKYHPDNYKINGISEREANRKFREVQEAYNLLEKELKNNSNNNVNYQNYYRNQEMIILKEAMMKELQEELKDSEAYFIILQKKISKLKNSDLVLNRYNNYQKILKREIAYLNIGVTTYESMVNLKNDIAKRRKHKLKEMNNDFWNDVMYHFVVYEMKKSAIWHKFKENYQYKETISIAKWVSTLVEDIDKLLEIIRLNLIHKDVDDIMINYCNYVYYEIVKNDLEQLKNDTIECLKKCNTKEEYNEIIHNLPNRANQIFVDYAEFIKKRQERIEKVSELMDSLKSQFILNFIESEFLSSLLVKLKLEKNEFNFSKIEKEIYSKCQRLKSMYDVSSCLNNKDDFIKIPYLDNLNKYFDAINEEYLIYPKNKLNSIKKLEKKFKKKDKNIN